MTRIIFHIDVNSAYLSWTAISLLKKGEPTDLRTIPSIIGGSIEDRHGIVLAKSTPAKKHGIVTGEPIIQAMQKCPNLIAYPKVNRNPPVLRHIRQPCFHGGKIKGRCRCQLSFIFHSFAPFLPKNVLFSSIAKVKNGCQQDANIVRKS